MFYRASIVVVQQVKLLIALLPPIQAQLTSQLLHFQAKPLLRH